ncbi:MAG: SDR family NAD(P)-dependent oxidoreductase [Planctomycetaceae bacterium]
MRDFRDKRVLITGAAAGIGRAMAFRFAREGAFVYLLDVDAPQLRDTLGRLAETGAKCDGAVCDLADAAALKAAVETVLDRCRTVDVLVNNAGVTYYGPTVRITPEQWERLLAVNFLAPVRLTQRLLPTLLSQPEAHVINVSSMYGLFVTPRSSAYHATKYGLIGYSEALRAEFSRFGLGVTSLCPGYVRTSLYDTAMRHKERDLPTPPRWLTTTPERVADKALHAVRRNRRLVLASPLAHLACYFGRLLPGFLDVLYRLGHQKTYRLPTNPPKSPTLPIPAVDINEMPMRSRAA